MHICRPRPISTVQAFDLTLQEFKGVSFDQCFELLASGDNRSIDLEDFPPEFGGALLPVLGLKPGPITLEQYRDFVVGDFPALKEFAGLSHARESNESYPAIYEVVVSMPKPFVLQLLMSGDKRMQEIVRDSNTAAMKELADYCCVRVTQPDGTTKKVRVQGLAYASWFHIPSRKPGVTEPRLHIRNLVHRLALPVDSDELRAINDYDIQIAHKAMLSAHGN